MNFEKLKGFAKSATEKTIDGVSKANEMRKKANSETTFKLPAPNQFTSSQTIRKTVDGHYYLGFYSETPELLEFVTFSFAGSKISSKTVTTGKQETKGRTGRTLIGAAIGATINPVGTVVGGIAGASGKKKGNSKSTSTTTTIEKPGKATITFRNIETQELKEINTRLTEAQADNLRNFLGMW
ncbi:hypothetical protein [Streptococcus sp. NLN76]|uniref:hypothetical protein n=1 Tax=Streptococcus sp. NLN76 TaxID=2822800 RepID=UPI0018A88BE6|nr:hypothetical protein [Streptococcus sp. NLN76]MBF8970200.1 hypothetical protein [Streptococcus sp. NLN76]